MSVTPRWLRQERLARREQQRHPLRVVAGARDWDAPFQDAWRDLLKNTPIRWF